MLKQLIDPSPALFVITKVDNHIFYCGESNTIIDKSYKTQYYQNNPDIDKDKCLKLLKESKKKKNDYGIMIKLKIMN